VEIPRHCEEVRRGKQWIVANSATEFRTKLLRYLATTKRGHAQRKKILFYLIIVDEKFTT